MELQKGDRVKLSDRALSTGVYRMMPSRFGTVYHPERRGYGPDVIWDGFKGGHDGYNDPENVVGHWYVPDTMLELVKAAKRPRPSIASDLKLKPQSKTVLRHLEVEGDISPMKALIVYGISRLAACINDIRNAGYKVSTVQRRDAQGHKYAQYALVK